ncbi:protein ABHD18 isoform X2 [Biomphalaria glabrata]|nr:protein ABHD18 isoform X2 [Biomphalaria glabrata]
MSMSRLDQLYRRLLLTKFFTHGWGKPENLKRLFAFRKILSNRETCQHLVPADYPIYIDKEYKDNGARILEGHFTSPFVHHLPGIMPKEVETASFQVILPDQWRSPPLKPICIHLAGTGDHYFWRRRFFTARPLLKETGIASILLENPYYGTRKPKKQLRSSLHNVSDLFVMGGALVLESLALLHWCEREGWGPLGLSGISMGGHMASGAATLWPKPISVIPILSWTTASVIFTQMASLAATNWTKPISLIPCLSWSTASCVFTEGVMSGAIPWQTLQEQFFENSVYQEEIRQLITSPEDQRRKAYDMGQQFVKDYSNSILHMESMHQHSTHPQIKKSTLVKQSIEHKKPSRGKTNLELDADMKGPKVSDTFLTPDEYLSHMNSEIIDKPSSTGDLTVNKPSSTGDLTAAQQQSSAHLSHSSNKLSSSASPLHSSIVEPMSLSSLVQESKLEPDRPNESIKQKQHMNMTAESESLGLKFAQSKSRLMKPTVAGEQVKDLQQEALDFMRGVMDECTHLGNFSVPVDPELIIIVSAKQDAYVPKEGVLGLDDLWSGCEVRHVNDGHIGAVLWHQSVFRKAISDAFERQILKYYQNPGQQPSESIKQVNSH